MKLYLTKTPRIIPYLFKKYTWRFGNQKKEIYLTFDDGPTPEVTNFVLDELQKFEAKATFFCIGKNAVNHPEIFKRIIAEDHSIGNHTQNHLKGLKNSCKKYIENVLIAEKNMQELDLSVNQNKLFRPPYGKIKKSQADKLISLGYQHIMWDVLSADFDAKINEEQCLQNVLKNTENGSIIVFHDSEKAAQKVYYALPKVLEHFSQLGYTFKKIG